MKINCDMGESFGIWKMGSDAQIMPSLDMANIACGFHASDPLTMTRTVRIAVEHGVTIGAHPSYPDLVGFGRRDMQVDPQELRSIVQYQIGALEAICKAEGTKVSYVKPHGALYNKMSVDDGTLRAVYAAISDYDTSLPLVVMAAPDHQRRSDIAAEYGLKLLFEAFSDRAYDSHGRLASRTLPGAVYQNNEEIERQVRAIVERSCVITLDGDEIPVKADTLCIHGDGPKALETARFIRGLIQP
ncbi:MAG: 5-oxoprolinase subunit PxpA [Oceanospirillaceae bacterium]|nr:5-oxoprolinase subunit PxpA [Oceanospirillaceae bacterium]